MQQPPFNQPEQPNQPNYQPYQQPPMYQPGQQHYPQQRGQYQQPLYIQQQVPPVQPIYIQQQMPRKKGPGCLVSTLYFLFIGSWLGCIWLCVAAICCITIIFAPIGISMMKQLPMVFALQPSN